MFSFQSNLKDLQIGPLQDLVTWYGINYAGMQVTQWDFQNKGKSDWTGMSSFVLKVPLCNLHPSIINSVPCDRILQRAYYSYKYNGLLLAKSYAEENSQPFATILGDSSDTLNQDPKYGISNY